MFKEIGIMLGNLQMENEKLKLAIGKVKEIAEDIRENDCYENSDAKAQKIIDIFNEVLND